MRVSIAQTTYGIWRHRKNDYGYENSKNFFQAQRYALGQNAKDLNKHYR